MQQLHAATCNKHLLNCVAQFMICSFIIVVYTYIYNYCVHNYSALIFQMVQEVRIYLGWWMVDYNK